MRVSFGAEVFLPDGSRRHVLIVRKEAIGNDREILYSRDGEIFQRRRDGLGLEAVDYTPPVPAGAVESSSTADEEAPALDSFDFEPDGFTFPAAVHGSSGGVETVRVKHTNARGDVVYVAADETGRTFESRPHGSGLVEIGGAT